MEIAVAVVVGALFGQFLNLAYERFFTGAQLRAPVSSCTACQISVRWWDALPALAYVRDRGRCASCGAFLPLRVIVLPAGVAVLFVVSYLSFAGLGGGLLGGFFAAIFFTLAITDLDRHLLPNRIVYPATVLAILFSWGWPDTSFLEILAGGCAGALIAAALLVVSLPFGSGSMGMGDAKMIVLMGFVLGLPLVIVGVVVGLLVTSVVAAALVVTRLRSTRDYIPQGPFLAVGAIVALFFGYGIWSP